MVSYIQFEWMVPFNEQDDRSLHVMASFTQFPWQRHILRDENSVSQMTDDDRCCCCLDIRCHHFKAYLLFSPIVRIIS